MDQFVFLAITVVRHAKTLQLSVRVAALLIFEPNLPTPVLVMTSTMMMVRFFVLPA